MDEKFATSVQLKSVPNQSNVVRMQKSIVDGNVINKVDKWRKDILNCPSKSKTVIAFDRESEMYLEEVLTSIIRESRFPVSDLREVQSCDEVLNLVNDSSYRIVILGPIDLHLEEYIDGSGRVIYDDDFEAIRRFDIHIRSSSTVLLVKTNMDSDYLEESMGYHFTNFIQMNTPFGESMYRNWTHPPFLP